MTMYAVHYVLTGSEVLTYRRILEIGPQARAANLKNSLNCYSRKRATPMESHQPELKNT